MPDGDVPIDLTAFLRPTADNFGRVVMALDKLLSENINTKFLCGKVSPEREKVRPDGRIEIQQKGSLTMLEEWLRAEIIWNDPDKLREAVIEPLRTVRKLRQKPAHTLTSDKFSTEYYDRRRKLLWAVVNSLSNIRVTLAKHPCAPDIRVPSWLDDKEIDVF